MRNIFPGYYKKTDKEIKEIWQNGVICFDANVLLNLYRYSNETRDELITLIEKFHSQIYLPHQSALEYNRNRYEVIAAQEKAYKDFISKINQIENDLKSTSKPPFLSTKNYNSLKTVFANVNSEVEESIKKYSGFLNHDEIYDRLSDIFKDKILNSFSEEELKEIYKEGKSRYENKLPPGYEDEKTKKDNRKYGDLVLWKQILRVAKEKKTPVILITDERKEDWWWKIKDGRNMGPRQELVQEMMKEAEVDFHMYSSERFMSYGLKYLKEQINKKAIEEIQEMARAERKILSREKARQERRLSARLISNKQYLEEAKYLDMNIEKTMHRINSLKHGIEVYKNEPIEKPEAQEQIIDFSIQLNELMGKLNILKKERNYLLEKAKYKRGIIKDIDFDESED